MSLPDRPKAIATSASAAYTARMDSHSSTPQPLDLSDLPLPVLRVVDELAGAGHTSLLVGACVRDWMAGRSPSDFEVSTAATHSEVLDLFPRSIPTRPNNAMVPTAAGPVDVMTTTAGRSPAEALAQRDFTIHAMGYDPRRRELHDPFAGRHDLAKGLLRAVTPAGEAFSKDALVALRVVRLVATLSLEVDGDLERAMGGVAGSLRRVAQQRVRFEISTILLAPGAPEALHLLRRSGIEEILAPGVLDDAPAVVRALPFDLAIRLAGWLRGTHSAGILRRMRFPRALAARVERLVRIHPIDAGQPNRLSNLHRLIKRTSEDDIAVLFALRRAEIASPRVEGREVALARLEALAAALDQVREELALKRRRTDLVIDGAGVMSFLGWEPGPDVGRALRHLTTCVARDPALNTRASLEAILLEWAREQAS